MRKIDLYIQDILQAIEKIQDFLEDMSFEEFINDEKTQYAIIRCLEIMGEAAKQIPPEIRNQFPNIPWKIIAGMRDKLIHGYFSINLEVIWATIQHDLPTIKPLLIEILKEINNKGLT